MLHEILLSLSGHHSPLLQRAVKDEAPTDDDSVFSQLSPSERSLLAKLAHLSELHIKIKAHIDQISHSYTSVICRAVSASITSVHLKHFRQKVLEVESSILSRDAGYVGGYAIVPLSTIVGEFAPWARRLEWLWDVVQFILPRNGRGISNAHPSCTGAAIIDHLRRELSTGYEDLHEMAVNLVNVAEMVWLRQLSSWLLYGKIPAHAGQDFFVFEDKSMQSSSSRQAFSWDPKLVPGFVTASTIRSILFIGRSLNHIRSQSSPTGPITNGSPGRWPKQHGVETMEKDSVVDMVPAHLKHLQSLTFPISPFALSSAVSSIRLSVSQNALSQLIPLPRVLEVLDVLHEFLLLGRGEFAMSLVSNADQRLRKRNWEIISAQPVRKAGRLDDIAIKDGEAASTLKQTWTELASLQEDDGTALELGKELLRLSTFTMPSQHASSRSMAFQSFLFPNATSLTLSISSDSPLKLFLSDLELHAYSTVHAYLISLRRADMHLSSLWKLTALRRAHPCPLGPPQSSTATGKAKLVSRQCREALRALAMRRYWATTGKALFVMSELGGYFQGEVIKNHWEHLQEWIFLLRPDARPPSSARSSRPGTASSPGAGQAALASSKSLSQPSQEPYDPATLAQAHQVYLHSLTSAMFLTNQGYVSALRELLSTIDHFVALFGRLLSVQQGLDLQEDDGVVDTLANYAADERDILSEMDRTRAVLEDSITVLVQKVRDVDEQKIGEGVNAQSTSDAFGELSLGEGGYVPWQGRTIDRLIMKLEYLAGEAVPRGQDDDDDNR